MVRSKTFAFQYNISIANGHQRFTLQHSGNQASSLSRVSSSTGGNGLPGLPVKVLAHHNAESPLVFTPSAHLSSLSILFKVFSSFLRHLPPQPGSISHLPLVRRSPGAVCRVCWVIFRREPGTRRSPAVTGCNPPPFSKGLLCKRSPNWMQR